MSAERYSFETRELSPGVTLHLHTSAKRKTNRLQVYYVGDLGDDVTLRSLLPSVLLRGTRTYPDLRAVTRRLEELYGTLLVGDVMKAGERHVIMLRCEYANDRYLPAGVSVQADVVDFLREVIGDPHLENGKFPAAVIAQEKENQRRFIESLFNNKRSYARERCIQEMCADEPFRLYEYGRVEDLASIGPDEVTDAWRRDVAGGLLHVYFSGNVAPEEAASALAPLTERADAAAPALRPLAELRGAAKSREMVEELQVQQAQLVLGYRTRTRIGDPLLEALVVGNGILGTFAHSKLFRNVREAASLCYSVGSSLERSQGLLLIQAGIDAARRTQAQALIEKQVADMQSGDFDDAELEDTKRAFDSRLKAIEDDPRVLMDIDLTWRLCDVPYDHESYRRGLRSVTRDQVVEAARRLELDTVYFLRPEEKS